MVVIALPRTPTCTKKILQITAQYFEIRALPDPQLALPDGEFRDPLPFRWIDAPQPSIYPLPSARCAACQ